MVHGMRHGFFMFAPIHYEQNDSFRKQFPKQPHLSTNILYRVKAGERVVSEKRVSMRFVAHAGHRPL